MEEESEVAAIQPSTKIKRCNEEVEGEYTYLTDKELKEELKRRKFKLLGRKRDAMIHLLEEEDKHQGRIVMSMEHRKGLGNDHQLRGESGGGEEEEGCFSQT